MASELWRDVVDVQRNWIGQCDGCRFNFAVKGLGEDDSLSVFTKNAEAVFGISYVVLPSSHRYNSPQYYREGGKQHPTYRQLVLNAVHPFTQKEVPVLVAMDTGDTESDTVLTDCVLGIPALSSYDMEVAEYFQFPWQPVYVGNQGEETLINSEQFTGLGTEEAREAIMAAARELGCGGHPVSSHLRDWLISRQRYWGTPIPIIHCPKCKAVPVPLDDLPVELPDCTTPGHSALKENTEWLNTTCPKCGGQATRETDTMDTFVDSSWYFLRYLDNKNTHLPVASHIADRYMPVDLYIGGKEHAYLHLYYARFVNHFLSDEGFTSHREPFETLLTQGMVKGESFKVAHTGVYLPADNVEKKGKQCFEKGTGEKVIVRFEKMSKSKHNGVDPEDLFVEFGADMTRLCILSNVAPKSERNWNNDVYVGVQKWLHRVWTLVGALVEPVARQPAVSHDIISQWDSSICEFRNKYLLEIRYHLDHSFLFNTAISRMHEFTSDLKRVPSDVAVHSEAFRHSVRDLVVLVAPSAPMFALECWAALQKAGIADKVKVFIQTCTYLLKPNLQSCQVSSALK